MSIASTGLLLAALAAVGYTLASFFLKGALGRGANAGQVNLAANVAMALVAQPLWWFQDPGIPNAPLWFPAITCCTFFLGQVFTFAALSRGDVSVATPLLGTKIIFVTALNALIFSTPIPTRWWVASFAASAAIAIIALGSPRGERRGTTATVLLSLFAAFWFSLSDVLVQRWAGAHDPFAYLPAMFGGVGLLSILYYGVVDRTAFRPPAISMSALCWGSLLLGIQASLVFLSLALARDATATNIVYALRSPMSVIAAWSFGMWFGLKESRQGGWIMLLRLGGAALLFGAILLILFP